MRWEEFGCLRFGDRQNLRLQVIVAQHKMTNFVCHAGQQFVAGGVGQRFSVHRFAEQDFNVHFVI